MNFTYQRDEKPNNRADRPCSGYAQYTVYWSLDDGEDEHYLGHILLPLEIELDILTDMAQHAPRKKLNINGIS